MPTHSKKEERKPKKVIKKKMKVPTITITEAPKKIKKKPKATPPVPPLEKKKFKIKLPKEEEKPKPKPKGKAPAKPKIDFDKIDETNSVLQEGIFDFEEFMTVAELNASSQSGQLRAFEKASTRINKHILKGLKKVAQKNKIKTTQELKVFLKKADSSYKMRNLLEDGEFPK